MIAHKHHYVPEWLQKRFLCNEDKYFYRDLKPNRVAKSDGTEYVSPSIRHQIPKQCFRSDDLYSVNFPNLQSDIVESKFFGPIDNHAPLAFEFFVTNKLAPSDKFYKQFLNYLSVQKIRTPKGLAWLHSFVSYISKSPPTQEVLMNYLCAIGEMHITTWCESVWEIVEAPYPEVGFLLTDHPVTAYNLQAPPEKHPFEPVIESLGTRTLFPLDARHCLIISNQEFVKNPIASTSLQSRTNPRSFSPAFFSPTHIIRGRILAPEQVWSINFILKKQALRYIAAPRESWLDPETQTPNQNWAQLDHILQPQKPILIQEIWAEYSDGKRVAIDGLGRPITAPEKLKEMEEIKRQTKKPKTMN